MSFTSFTVGFALVKNILRGIFSQFLFILCWISFRNNAVFIQNVIFLNQKIEKNHFQVHLKPTKFPQDTLRGDCASPSWLYVFKFLFLAMYKLLHFSFLHVINVTNGHDSWIAEIKLPGACFSWLRFQVK